MLKPSGIITLLTDFGWGSSYAASLYGVILSINPQARIVDLTHTIPPQDIQQGSLVLQEAAPLFPPGTIHVAIVDPGVGSKREILLAQAGDQFYIAPNNGLLGRIWEDRLPPERNAADSIPADSIPADSIPADSIPAARCIQLTNRQYWRPTISHTFHGRDIMAPVAAHLSLGVDFNEFGAPFDAIRRIAVRQPVVSEKQIQGIIEQIDSFGNLITNIKSEMFQGRPTDERVHIFGANFKTWGIFDSYASQPPGVLIATVGSNNYLEIAVVNDSAAKRFQSSVGDPVTLSWE